MELEDLVFLADDHEMEIHALRKEKKAMRTQVRRSEFIKSDSQDCRLIVTGIDPRKG